MFPKVEGMLPKVAECSPTILTALPYLTTRSISKVRGAAIDIILEPLTPKPTPRSVRYTQSVPFRELEVSKLRPDNDRCIYKLNLPTTIYTRKLRVFTMSIYYE